MKKISIALSAVASLGLFLGFVPAITQAQTFYANQPPACTIALSEVPSGYPDHFVEGRGLPMLLTWSAANAASASISPALGEVPLRGSEIVYSWGQTFSMAVYNTNGRTAVCQTTPYLLPMQSPFFPGSIIDARFPTFSTFTNYPVDAIDFVDVDSLYPIAQTSHVSLTQIPYTGVGDVATAMLAWLSIIIVAMFGASVIASRNGFTGKISSYLRA